MRPPLGALVAALWFAPAVADEGVTGAEAVRLVQAAMAAAGVPAAAMAVPVRALPACAHTPRVAPQGKTWATAALACEAPQPWRRVLRTGSAAAVVAQHGAADGPATGPALVPVLVLVRPMQRGARIAPADLALRALAGTDPAQRLQDPAMAAGRRLRVALGAGQPVLERHLEPALDIEAGQTVTVQLTAPGMDIALAATALQSGVAGDRIAVRRGADGPPVEALVVAPGIVRVRPNMPRQPAVTGGNGG
jgi:flagella basal body P-ring formation protein FlgA